MNPKKKHGGHLKDTVPEKLHLHNEMAWASTLCVPMCLVLPKTLNVARQHHVDLR